MDNEIIEPIMVFIDNPEHTETLRDVIESCLYAWLYSCKKDYKYQESDEYAIENIELNEYEFDENGNIA